MKLLSPESVNKPDIYIVGDKEFKVECYIKTEETAPDSQFIPLLDIPFMSDYKWQLNCLKDRLEHPEKYEKTEDVAAAIKRLENWLAENVPQ